MGSKKVLEKNGGILGKGGRTVYRICKVLNHNGVIALDMKDNKEYVLLGKGVGFGKKVGERWNNQKSVPFIRCRKLHQEERL